VQKEFKSVQYLQLQMNPSNRCIRKGILE